MSFRLVLYCIYLSLLFLCCGYIYHFLTQFSGHMIVARGGAENVVVREAGGGFPGPHRAVAPALLPFSDPRAEGLLDPNQAYDGAILPFHLRLDAVEVLAEFPPHDVLDWERGRHTRSQPIKMGDQVCFEGAGCVEALGVAPWSGLLFQPGGAPMISVRFRAEGREARHMLETGRQVQIEEIPVYFAWYPDEESARDALGESLPDAMHTRWGVEDGDAVTWMSHPSPGQGMTSQDGREWTVLAVQLGPEDEARLSLELREDGRREEVLLRPGSDSAYGLHFEAPGHAERSFVIHGYPGEEAYVGEYRRGLRQDTHLLDTGGEGIRLGEGSLVLEELMASAIPIVAEENAIQALEVESDAGRHILREGERMPWQGGFLIYRRKPTAPEVACAVSALSEGGVVASGRLEPGDWIRIENWYFRIANGQYAPQVLIFEGQRSGFARPSSRIGLGLLVFGAFGLVFVRFYRRPGGVKRTRDYSDQYFYHEGHEIREGRKAESERR